MAEYVLTSIQVDVAKAREAVAARGTPRQRARLASILGALDPERETAQELTRLQNADGGFPVEEVPGASSDVAVTCRILSQLKELPPLAGSPMASRAVAFLRRTQQPGGSWGEADPALTAQAAYTILTLEPGHLDPVLRSSGWLRRELARTEVEVPGPLTLAMAWAVWAKVLGPDASEARWAFRLLEQTEMGAADLAQWLLCALEVGAGGPYLLPLARRMGQLAALQQPDGLWSGGGASPVENTLTALRVFRLCGLVTEG